MTVIEREPVAGGLAAAFEAYPGVWIEKFYHHLFRSDRHAIGLLHELGIGDRLEWRRPITATFTGGRLHQLDSPASLLRFSPLSIRDRLRMGAVLAGLRAMPNPRLLEGQTAADWLRRWMGSSAFETVWEPLLEGKFGATAAEIGMPWFWARVHDRTTELGYLRGGFQQLYEQLAVAVREAGGETRFGETVVGVRQDREGFIVETTAGSERFDAVVSTLPTRLTARLVPELPAVWRERHEWGRAFGAHCLIVALDRPLTDAYWVNVNDPGFPFMAVVEHTNYSSPSDYGNRHIVYLGNYRPMADPLMSASMDAVLDEFLPHLPRLNPRFDPSWVVDAWMFAAPYAQPIVTVDYRNHIPPFETPLRDLWTANMFQVYPHDRGQNNSIDLAERLVARMNRGRA